MRLIRHLLLAALALALLAGAPAAVAGTPVGIAESFPTKCDVDAVAAKPDGGAWFACRQYTVERHLHVSVRADAGIVSAAGEVTEFAGSFPKGSVPGSAVGVIAADGSFWFPVEGDPETLGKPTIAPSLARVTPTGDVTLFPVPDGYVAEMLATAEGNVLFVTAAGYLAKERATWQIAPNGKITKPAVEPALPLEQPTFPQKPVVGPGSILAGSVIGADGNLWYGVQSGEGSAIGRVTPVGQATEFKECLRYGQPYFGPETLVRGAEGNIWFTSLAERSLPNIVDPASIGMITPAGAITQFYAGVTVEPKTIAADSEGGAWFAGGLEEVQRIKPPQGVVNTVHIGKLDGVRADGSALLGVKVPGAGNLRAKAVAVITGKNKKTRKRIAIHAPTGTASTDVCGSPQVRVKLAGEALRQLHASGKVRVAVAVTFTPQGGHAYSEEKVFRFQLPHHR